MNRGRFGCAVAAAIGIAIAASSVDETALAQGAQGRGATAPAPAPSTRGTATPAPARGAAPAQTRGAATGPQAPRLEVDPLWPQPFAFEKHWALGSVTGVFVDSQDHIWVTHRGVDSLQTNEKGPTLATWAAECCYAAPQVLEFDVSGKLLDSWGGPGQGYQWPQNPSGIAVDSKGNVWIAAAGCARSCRCARCCVAPLQLQQPGCRNSASCAAAAQRLQQLRQPLRQRVDAAAARRSPRQRPQRR